MLKVEAPSITFYQAHQADILRKTKSSAKKRIHADGRLGLDAFVNAEVYCEEPTMVQPTKDNIQTYNQLGLDAFVNAVVYCEEPAKVGHHASWKEDRSDRYRPPGTLSESLNNGSDIDVLPIFLFGWSVTMGYLISGGATYITFLAGLPEAFCALLFIFLGGILTLGITFTIYALFGDSIAKTKGVEQRATEDIGSDTVDFSKLTIEALDSILDQPVPDQTMLNLKRNSLTILLDIVERRLESMEMLDVNEEQESQQLQTVRDQLVTALSLSDAQEMARVDLGNSITSKRRKRVA